MEGGAMLLKGCQVVTIMSFILLGLGGCRTTTTVVVKPVIRVTPIAKPSIPRGCREDWAMCTCPGDNKPCREIR
jgi:hypothetical protein